MSLIRFEITDPKIKENLVAVAHLPYMPTTLGFHEIYVWSFYRACLIELIGSAWFTYIHVKLVLAATNTTNPPTYILQQPMEFC